MKNNSPRRIYTENPLTFDVIGWVEVVQENPVTFSYSPDWDGDTYEVEGAAGRWISHGDQLLFVTWENDVLYCKTLGDFEILAVDGNSIKVKEVEG